MYENISAYPIFWWVAGRYEGEGGRIPSCVNWGGGHKKEETQDIWEWQGGSFIMENNLGWQGGIMDIASSANMEEIVSL